MSERMPKDFEKLLKKMGKEPTALNWVVWMEMGMLTAFRSVLDHLGKGFDGEHSDLAALRYTLEHEVRTTEKVLVEIRGLTPEQAIARVKQMKQEASDEFRRRLEGGAR